MDQEIYISFVGKSKAEKMSFDESQGSCGLIVNNRDYHD